MSTRLVRSLPFILLAMAIALVGPMSTVRAASTSDSTIILVSPMQSDKEPVTAYFALTSEITTLDPQLVEDNTAVSPVENLFLGLTDVDPASDTGEVRPEMATKWEHSDDGLTWTFTLRNDVPWVRWNPQTQEAEKLDMVTAQDFEYGIKRACDPRTAGYYGKVVAAIIEGCDKVKFLSLDEFDESMLDQVQVKALSDTQLQIKLRDTFSFFESVTSLWMMRAVPRKTIEEFGEDWTQPGNIVTNGWFVIDTWNYGVNRIFLRNPLLPKDFQDNYGGNLERMYITVVRDGNTIYNKYQNSEVDVSGVPLGEQDAILNDPARKDELIRSYDLTIAYFGFAYDKPPFDNVHVRRAFSAIIDRKTLTTDLLAGRALPMAHFTPPGVFGAVNIDEVGVGDDPSNLGFDPEYAKKEFEAAGYTDCSNFPTITIIVEASEYAEYLQNQLETHLGCDPSKVTIQQAEFRVKEDSIKPDNPTAQRPNMWVSLWGPDYLDANNYLGDVLYCKVENPFKRPCGPIDEKIEQAARETDPDKRIELYREVEEMFFGKDGDFVVAPMYTSINFALHKPWYTGLFDTDALLGGSHWETRKIDQEAQLAARGGATPGDQGGDNGGDNGGDSGGDNGGGLPGA